TPDELWRQRHGRQLRGAGGAVAGGLGESAPDAGIPRMSPTILIMAGGTGGHVFPGLAVADYMRAAGWRVVWLGTERGMEGALASRQGYVVETIRFSGLRGKGLATWLTLPARLL